MKTKLFYLLLLIFALGVKMQAQVDQSDSIRFSGVIFDKDSLTVLPYALYSFGSINYTSNSNGEFYTWAKQGDVIKFSYVGYKDKYIQVDDTLDQNNYLIGVFLSRDTIMLSEVIVIPRYQQLLAEAKYMPLIITPEMVYGNRNVKASTRQALTTVPEKMDAEQNRRMVIAEQTRKNVYKGQISPDMMFGPSTEKRIVFTMYESPNVRKQIQKASEVDLLNRQEMQFLLNLYKEQKKRAINVNE